MDTLAIERKTIEKTVKKWEGLRQSLPLHAIRTKKEYQHAVNWLNSLLDIGGGNEKSTSGELVKLLSVFIAEYEQKNQPTSPALSALEMLQFLMQQHQMKQSDMRFIGSQGVVSEILSGKRALTIKHIDAIAKHFNVSPSLFMEGK